MANSFNKEEVVLFERVLEKFDTDNIIAREAEMFSQPGEKGHLSSFVSKALEVCVHRGRFDSSSSMLTFWS